MKILLSLLFVLPVIALPRHEIAKGALHKRNATDAPEITSSVFITFENGTEIEGPYNPPAGESFITILDRSEYPAVKLSKRDHGCFNTIPCWYTTRLITSIRDACNWLDGDGNGRFTVPKKSWYRRIDQYGTEYKIHNDYVVDVNMSVNDCNYELNFVKNACKYSQFSYSGWTRHPSGYFRSDLRIGNKAPL